MSRQPNTAETATLTPLNFQILVALVEGERHGYAIMQQIEERAGGAFRIGAGSLYRAIKQLVDAKFITEAKPKLQVHSQRRYYRITATGRRRARAEARLFHGMVAWAQDAGVLDR